MSTPVRIPPGAILTMRREGPTYFTKRTKSREKLYSDTGEEGEAGAYRAIRSTTRWHELLTRFNSIPFNWLTVCLTT